jgi:hypothetical protein
MGVRMTHPTLPADHWIEVDPIAVPHHAAAGWQVEPGQEETGEEWPAELQRFEGQEQVRMRHPDLDAEITVARSAVANHQSNGWYQVSDDVPLPSVADGLEGRTVEQLRERARELGLPVSGTKPELIERLRTAPAAEEPATPADQESEE